VDVRAGKRLRLGASAGAAVFPSDGPTYEALLAAADHLMYRDKAARRGQTPTPPRASTSDYIAPELFPGPLSAGPADPLPHTLS
jgi:hypothetical protein